MTLLIALILAPLIVLTACFAVELVAGLMPLRQVFGPASVSPATAIIVPAHDEQAVIGDTIRALMVAAGERTRIVVVADNCTDATARIARESGVEVIERTDPDRRGKGFALDFAREHLRTDPVQVVVILDADCTTDRISLDRLVGACAGAAAPCQAIYVQEPVPTGPVRLQLSTFAFFIKNVIRQRAQQRIAGRVHLLGTGMAIPWALFDRAQLASSNIVEDMEMGLEFADLGHPPRLVEGALVSSAAASAASTIEQRRRWEGGYLQSAGRWGPRLLARAFKRLDVRELWAAISLFIPPVALLVTLDIAAIAIASVASWLLGAAAWPVLLLIAALGLAGIGIVAAWAAGGARFIRLARLATVPAYLLWKLPLYLHLARKGAPKDWVRTGRTTEAD